MNQRRFQEAISSLEDALRLDSGQTEAARYLGLAYSELGQSTLALRWFERALELNPSLISVLNDLSGELCFQGRVDEAIRSYRELLVKSPDADVAAHNLLLTLNYDHSLDPHSVFQEHVQWGRRLMQRIGSQPLHTNVRNPNRRLRIGYVSPDFLAHSVAFFIEPVLANHNHDRVEIYCYAASARVDAMTEWLRSLATHWRSIHDMDDTHVVELIRNDQIDILVDLAGHTDGTRLEVFAHQPAPVQVTYLGYPNTTGLPTMHYRLTDAIADPDSFDHLYTETLVRLPRSFLCYMQSEHAPAVQPLPSLRAGHVTFGSFNNLAKIRAETVALWAQILKTTTGSRLLLKSSILGDDNGVRTRYLEMFFHHGIEPDRLELLGRIPGRAAHLDVYNRVDIALDTFPYNGTTTTCEALWMGVPVVTLEGNHHAGRVGVSLLTQVGLTDLIAKTQEDYVNIAVRLASELPKLASLRADLRQQMAASPLCDAQTFTRNLEAAYREMWLGWCAKQSMSGKN